MLPYTTMPHYRPFVTSSGVDRFMLCCGSATLPTIYDEHSAAANAGTAEHLVRLQPGMLPPRVLAWFGGVEPIYEVAMATDMSLDGNEVRYLGNNIERGYGTYPSGSWLAGTGDLNSIVGDVVSAGDLKTGKGQSRGSLPPPEQSGQLLSNAYMMIRLRQLRDAAWRPGRIRLMWWMTADRDDDLVDAEVTYNYLMGWQQSLRRAIHAAHAQNSPRLHRGAHCGMCPAFDACPAQGGAIRRVRGFAEGAALTPSELVQAHLDCQAAEKQVDAAKRSLRLRVLNGGAVPVDDAHELRLVQGTDTRLDPNVAFDVLGERFADCATVTISQDGLRRGGVDVEAVMSAMQQRGGVVTAPKAAYLKVMKRKVV